MLVRRPTTGWILALASLATACDVYDSSLLNIDNDTVGVVPERPDNLTSSPADSEEVAFAIDDVILNPASSTTTLGLDLDGLNTFAPNYVSECTIPNRTPPADGLDGVDN